MKGSTLGRGPTGRLARSSARSDLLTWGFYVDTLLGSGITSPDSSLEVGCQHAQWPASTWEGSTHSVFIRGIWITHLEWGLGKIRLRSTGLHSQQIKAFLVTGWHRRSAQDTGHKDLADKTVCNKEASQIPRKPRWWRKWPLVILTAHYMLIIMH